MPGINPYEKYREQSVSTQTPGELIILLYDRAMFHMNAAIRCIERKKPGEAHTSIRKAQDIILYLRSILDFRFPVSGTLENYYAVVLRQLSKANVKKEQASLEDAVSSMRELRDTWKQIEKQNHENASGGRGGL